jgi:XTP/dITP diphosphohydrolase
MIDRPLVLATRNKGKISEFKALISEFRIEMKSLKDFGHIPPIAEDGKTFEDNACKKALFTAKRLGFPALADDSGLMVEALGGIPGVRSARYAGEKAADKENNRKLLQEMKGVADRKATFKCVIAIALPKGPSLIFEGVCHGEIAHELKGKNGFGYDPLFYYPPLRKTFAQLPTEEKNRVSHRGKAMAQLRSELDKVQIWLGQRLAGEGGPSPGEGKETLLRGDWVRGCGKKD